MTKIYPNASSSSEGKISGDDPVVLTVWKKSLLLNCEGFTVFDPRGNLRLSLGDTWLIFDGETTEDPGFTVRKNVSLLNSRCLAYVFQKKSLPLYQIEGSYSRRCCAVYDEKRRRVAEIRQKEAAVTGVAFGKDVFRLEVQPGFDTEVAMGMVILLDQMYASGRFI
ncbi:hypothetical protein SASPL_139250 [Salvia splendens]|uniref:Protein LURP-one-related 8 n=1 Tax=Salvia splendens TaxID=180675 RepID=A0A8X8ZEN0_SALSN|nr:hypothetical protein SASPL_139250 [Salvia splendens]